MILIPRGISRFPRDFLAKNDGCWYCLAKGTFVQSSFHAKYVDDLTLAEAFNLKENLEENPDRPLPDPYRARTGHRLCPEKSMVYSALLKTKTFAEDNQMQLNVAKTNFMVFNPTKMMDFLPRFVPDEKEVETVETLKLLGFVISSNLSWKENTRATVKKGYQRLWPIRRLKKTGADLEDLLEIYTKQVRPILEYDVPVWNSSITLEEENWIE